MIRLVFSPEWSSRVRLLSMASAAVLLALSGHAQAQDPVPACKDLKELTPECVELLNAIAPAAGPVSVADASYPVSDNHGNDDASGGGQGNQGNGGQGNQGNGGQGNQGSGGQGNQGNGGQGNQGNSGQGNQGNGGQGNQGNGGQSNQGNGNQGNGGQGH